MPSETATMRAWTFTKPGFPDCLSQTTLPAPTADQLKPTYLLLRTRAAAINPVDIQVQNLPIFHIPIWPLNVAKITGCDVAGEVLAAGSKTGFKKGDNVMGVSLWQGWNGTMAECVMVDTAQGCFIKKPELFSFESAAALPLVWLTARTMIGNAEQAMEKSQNKRITILGGSSATGMYCVYLAQQRRWKVLSTCSGRNVDFVKSMGASEVVDYTQQNVREEVRKYAPDAIIDCVGGTECVDLAKRYITIVGDKTTRSTMGGSMIYLWNPRMLIRWALGRYGLSSVQYDCSNIDFQKPWLEEVTKLQQDKLIIDSVFEFDKAKEAFERLNTSRARGKVVVKI